MSHLVSVQFDSQGPSVLNTGWKYQGSGLPMVRSFPPKTVYPDWVWEGPRRVAYGRDGSVDFRRGGGTGKNSSLW